MKTADIDFLIHAPIERTFAVLADHERFFHGGQVTRSVIVKPGSPERGGLGALREVHNLGVRFVERITCYEPPHRLGYLVTECSIPLRHDGGMVTLARHGGATRVHWHTRFVIDVPLAGAVLAEVFRRGFVREIERLLGQAKAELEGRPGIG